MYSRVILLKDNGQSQGFDTLALAMAAADANDLINMYPGAHAVVNALAAKSNVTINVLPRATVTFVQEILLAADITNFKISGGGNLIFTKHIFSLTGKIGDGNEIAIDGDIETADGVVYSDAGINQDTPVKISGNNLTLAGFIGLLADGNTCLAFDGIGAQTIYTELQAKKLLGCPSLSANGNGNNLRIVAKEILLTGNGRSNFGQVTVECYKLNLANNVIFFDPDVNFNSSFTFLVDKILFNSASGIMGHPLYVTFSFEKHVVIKNSSNANPAHVIVYDNELGPAIAFREGAVLFSSGGVLSKCIKTVETQVVSTNRTIYSNVAAQEAVITGADLVIDAGIFG